MFGLLKRKKPVKLTMKLVSEWSLMEKFEYLDNNKAEVEVFLYLENLLKNVSISILGKEEKSIMELMYEDKLQGWCWQTSQTSALFFNDKDYIARGYLVIDEGEKYEYAWICFTFKGKQYVFDPCLQCVCKKSLYDKILQACIEGKCLVKDVKKYFIEQYRNYYKEKSIVTSFLLDYMSEKQKREKTIKTQNDLSAPFYRGNDGYIAEIVDDEIKSIYSHFYYSGMF